MEAAGEQGVPGAIPATQVGAIPDWYIVGWRQAAGLNKAPVLEGEEKEKSILEQYLSEQFYGSWYHNAAVIVLVRALDASLPFFSDMIPDSRLFSSHTSSLDSGLDGALFSFSWQSATHTTQRPCKGSTGMHETTSKGSSSRRA